ncbi:MAG: PIN domain-containing protein [Edaphobacter sp.]
MGLILDSSVVIAAERRGATVAQLLGQIVAVAGDQRAVLSAVGLTELVHATWRSKTPEVRRQRERFIEDLLADMDVVSYTKDTAMLAGRIDGEQRSQGVTIPSVDLLIGATALEHGYAMATVNIRHFRLIPGLQVIAF